jgi:hypothetical protein
MEKVVKGIKHNTIRSVSFRGTHAKSKQFIDVADAMRINTTVVTVDISYIKCTPLSRGLRVGCPFRLSQ